MAPCRQDPRQEPSPRPAGAGDTQQLAQTEGGHELGTRVSRNRPVPRRKHGHVSCKASGCVIHGGKLSTKLHPPGLTLGRAMLGAQGGTQGQQSACDRGCPGRAWSHWQSQTGWSSSSTLMPKHTGEKETKINPRRTSVRPGRQGLPLLRHCCR